jgi:hypothetical protein
LVLDYFIIPFFSSFLSFSSSSFFPAPPFGVYELISSLVSFGTLIIGFLIGTPTVFFSPPFTAITYVTPPASILS